MLVAAFINPALELGDPLYSGKVLAEGPAIEDEGQLEEADAPKEEL